MKCSSCKEDGLVFVDGWEYCKKCGFAKTNYVNVDSEMLDQIAEQLKIDRKSLVGEGMIFAHGFKVGDILE